MHSCVLSLEQQALLSRPLSLYSTNHVIYQIKSIVPIPIISPLSLGELDLSGRAKNPTCDSGNPREVDYQIYPLLGMFGRYMVPFRRDARSCRHSPASAGGTGLLIGSTHGQGRKHGNSTEGEVQTKAVGNLFLAHKGNPTYSHHPNG